MLHRSFAKIDLLAIFFRRAKSCFAPLENDNAKKAGKAQEKKEFVRKKKTRALFVSKMLKIGVTSAIIANTFTTCLDDLNCFKIAFYLNRENLIQNVD